MNKYLVEKKKLRMVLMAEQIGGLLFTVIISSTIDYKYIIILPYLLK